MRKEINKKKMKGQKKGGGENKKCIKKCKKAHTHTHTQRKTHTDVWVKQRKNIARKTTAEEETKKKKRSTTGTFYHTHTSRQQGKRYDVERLNIYIYKERTKSTKTERQLKTDG